MMIHTASIAGMLRMRRAITAAVVVITNTAITVGQCSGVCDGAVVATHSGSGPAKDDITSSGMGSEELWWRWRLGISNNGIVGVVVGSSSSNRRKTATTHGPVVSVVDVGIGVLTLVLLLWWLWLEGSSR